MWEPTCFLHKGFVADAASVGLNHDMCTCVLLKMGFSGEYSPTQPAGEFRWRFTVNFGIIIFMLGNNVRLQACHGLKWTSADVTVVTFPLMHSLDMKFQAILQGIWCATFFTTKLGFLAWMCQSFMPLYVEMAIWLVWTVRTGENWQGDRPFAIGSSWTIVWQWNTLPLVVLKKRLI